MPETILKSIIYVRNMIKAESVNVSLQRHLAAFSESFDCLQKESEWDNVNDDDDRADIISLLVCCKINSVWAFTFTFQNYLKLNIDSNAAILGVAKKA